MTMQLQPETLRHLDKLEVLDLADNNIWGLPEGALCHTPALQSLNLSRNNIVEVSEVGLSGNICQLLHLKTLDLSFNKISSFLPGDLSQAPGLSSLDLRGNRLSVLSPTSLSSLWSLAHLDLSDNNLAALPPTIFQQSSNLQKLFLQNNSLSLLSPDLFSGLDNLLLLNISRNDISSHLLSHQVRYHLVRTFFNPIALQIFDSLTKLVALDLSHNALTKLHGELDQQATEPADPQPASTTCCSPTSLTTRPTTSIRTRSSSNSTCGRCDSTTTS